MKRSIMGGGATSSSNTMMPPPKKTKSSSSETPPPFDLKQSTLSIKKQFEQFKHLYEKSETNPKLSEIYTAILIYLDRVREEFTLQPLLMQQFVEEGLNGLQFFIDLFEYEHVITHFEKRNTNRNEFYPMLLNTLLETTSAEDTTYNEQEEASYDYFMDAFIANQDLICLLFDFMIRMVQQDESFINHSFGIIENLLEYDTDVLQHVPREQLSQFMTWMVMNVDRKHDIVLQHYTVEVLYLMVSNEHTTGIPIDMNQLLVVLNGYRQHMTSEEEDEIAENLFNTIGALVLKTEKTAFREGEGMELMLHMIKDKKKYRLGALRVLTYAMEDCLENVKHFMECGGMKTLFALFMKLDDGDEMDSFIVNILVNLLSLDDEVKQRIRNKFEERQYEKSIVLCRLIYKYYKKVYIFDKQVELGDADMMMELFGSEQVTEEDVQRKRLTFGLFTLQKLCQLLFFICKSDGIREFVTKYLKDEYKIEMETLKIILEDYDESLREDDTKQSPTTE